ncbi:hypothetical protein A2U01_0018935, partial [Trifolium medium]|nr:hypothetical protein [Trifolium medium]
VDGSGSSPSTAWCCAISAVDFYCTVAISIIILLIDGSDLTLEEKLERAAGEDPDRRLTSHKNVTVENLKMT